MEPRPFDIPKLGRIQRGQIVVSQRVALIRRSPKPTLGLSDIFGDP
jgi:hypothetical protein